MSENDKLTELQLALLQRHDQILLLDKLSALEKRVDKLQRRLKDWEDVVALSQRRRPKKKGPAHGRH